MFLSAKLSKSLDALPEILDDYTNELNGVREIINMKGKTLEECNRENSTWQHYYDYKRVELNGVVKFLEQEVARIRSKLYRQYKEKHSIELSDREIQRYIDGEAAFLSMNQVLLDVKELYDAYQSVVDAFTSRGYSLNNITRSRVAEVHDSIL